MPPPDYVLDHRGDLILVLGPPTTEIKALERADEHHATPTTPVKSAIAVATSDDNGEKGVQSKQISHQKRPVSNQDHEYHRYQVSSRHLCLASPVFRAMLEGPWAEGQHDAEIGRTREITTSEWDAQALLIVLRVIHGQNRSVPRAVTAAQLQEIAIIVDYYQCHEAVEFFGDFWVPAIKKGCPTTSAEGALPYFFIASVFRKKHLFQTAAGVILGFGKGPLNTGRLPISPTLVESLDRRRCQVINILVKGVNMLQKQLYDGGVCKQGNYLTDGLGRASCDALFLRFLLRQTWNAALGKEPPLEPYHGYGAWTLIHKLSTSKNPPSAHATSTYPSCTFKGMNQSTISNAKDLLEGYTLGFDGQWRPKQASRGP